VARSIHVRLDDASEAALDIIRAGGLTDSEAVRTALREAAARRRADWLFAPRYNASPLTSAIARK
jgi:hypothetical protein